MTRILSTIGAILLGLAPMLPLVAGEVCRIPRGGYVVRSYSREYDHAYDDTPEIVSPGVIVQHNLAPAYLFQIQYPFVAPTPPAVVPTPSPVPTPAPAPPASPPSTPPAALSAAPPAPPPGRLSEEDRADIAARVVGLLKPPDPDEDGPPPLAADAPHSLAEAPPAPIGPARPEPAGTRVIAALTTSCARCHDAGTHKGDIALFDQAGRFNPTTLADHRPIPRAEIVEAIRSGRMPRDGRTNPARAFPADVLPLLDRWTAEN